MIVAGHLGNIWPFIWYRRIKLCNNKLWQIQTSSVLYGDFHSLGFSFLISFNRNSNPFPERIVRQSTRRALSYPITYSFPVKGVRGQKVRPLTLGKRREILSIYIVDLLKISLSYLDHPQHSFYHGLQQFLPLLLQMYIKFSLGESSAWDAVKMHASLKREKKRFRFVPISNLDILERLCSFRRFVLNSLFHCGYLHKFIFLFVKETKLSN